MIAEPRVPQSAGISSFEVLIDQGAKKTWVEGCPSHDWLVVPICVVGPHLRVGADQIRSRSESEACSVRKKQEDRQSWTSARCCGHVRGNVADEE